MAEQQHGQHRTEIDELTGTPTTGHEWDGLRELNNPLPRWWLWTFYATIIWAIGYWIVYPSWPLISSYTQGLSGWHAREQVVRDLEALKAQRGPMAVKLAETPLDQILDDPDLLAFARAQARPAFMENCAPCHGAGGGGFKGYPNLNDDDWLWGGKLDDIAHVIRHGIRSADPESRAGFMPAFGRDGMLTRPQIVTLAHYTRSLAGLPVDPKADLAAGKTLYAENCVTCHGEAGKGNRELGAPDLTDAIWLYGSELDNIVDGMWNGRAGVMPGWAARIDESTIRALTVYVHTLGGGER